MSKLNEVNELTRFCNNLGKAFRKLTEDTETRMKTMEKEIKDLKAKNKKFEKDISDWDTEDLEERLISNEKEFYALEAKISDMIEKNVAQCGGYKTEQHKKLESIEKNYR